jgi:hypothetical protein
VEINISSLVKIDLKKEKEAPPFIEGDEGVYIRVPEN